MSSGNVQNISGRPPEVPDGLSNLATLKLAFVARHVLLVTLSRPKALNVINAEMETELGRVMHWADEDDNVWVIVLTGEGSVFCAGGDLKPAINTLKAAPEEQISPSLFYGVTGDGFGFLSRRPHATKPFIAAVNGLIIGGGVEIILNCDLVVASEKAEFWLTETKNGFVAFHGAIPRLARTAGHQLASEAYLTGRVLSAQEARDRFTFVNRVVADTEVLTHAIGMANQITALATSTAESKSTNESNSSDKIMSSALKVIRTMKRELVESRNLGILETVNIARL